jgi:hypothetical protein
VVQLFAFLTVVIGVLAVAWRMVRRSSGEGSDDPDG